MALINKNTQEYLKINFPPDIISGKIHFNIFRDQEQRLAFDSGLSPYENFKCDTYPCPDLKDRFGIASTKETIYDDIMSICYGIIKDENWDDC